MKNNDIKLVTVRQFTSQSEAAIIESLLAANGIDCSLVHATLAGVLPVQSSQFSVDLVARAEDLERINELLKAKFDKNDMK